MKLSIVVVALNEERHLPRCLDTIRGLEPCDLELELIVVDGGSTDRTRELAAEGGARVVESEKGIPRQRNAGARAATGELLAYVDADIELCEGWFATVARHFEGDRRLILGCPPRLPDDASWIAQAYAMHWGAPGEEVTGVSDDARLLSTASLIMGREVYDLVGGFAENMGVDEDTFLIKEACRHGVRTVCDFGLKYLHHGEPRTVGEFMRRIAWGANAEEWFELLRKGDFTQARRPQYIYGAVMGAELASLGLRLAVPVGGWLVGVPLSAAALAATVVLPSVNTARKSGAPGKVGELCLMYGAYGLATAAALAGVGKDKARRWR